MKRNLFLPLVLAVTLGSAMAFPARGQEAHIVSATNVLTLDAAIQLALANNPELRGLTADIAAARGAVITVTTWQNPELGIAPGMDHQRDVTTQFHANFDLQQTFEWPGKRALRKAVAEKNVAARQLALMGFRTQLAVQVRRAYSLLLASREFAELRAQRLTLAESFVDAAKKRAEGGYAPDFEATKAGVEVVAARIAVRDAQARQDTARVMLNSLLGRDPSEPIFVEGTISAEAEMPDSFTLIEKALALNPAIKLQEAEAEKTGLSLQSIRKSRLPDFKIGPSVEYMPSEQIVGLGVTLPLPLWDKKKGEIATATAEQEKALAEVEKLRREIIRDVAMASQNLRAAQDSLDFFTPDLREKLKSSLDAAAQGYAEGKTPLLLYLEAQRTYFDTQANYFDSLQRVVEMRAELESSIGAPLDQINSSNQTK